MEVYIQILREYILPEIKASVDFILEENRDGSHYSEVSTAYKKEIGLEYYLNCRISPDLSVLENPVALTLKNRF